MPSRPAHPRTPHTLPPGSDAGAVIRSVAAQTLRLERDLATSLHGLALCFDEQGRTDEAADARSAALWHRVQAIEVQALLALVANDPDAGDPA